MNMGSTRQISAHISASTKDLIEAYVRETGVTRGHLVEQAILHHLQALRELPPEAIVPTRVVLTKAGAKRVRDLVTRPPGPTEDMQRLFDDR
jgi:hypothetical protein